MRIESSKLRASGGTHDEGDGAGVWVCEASCGGGGIWEVIGPLAV